MSFTSTILAFTLSLLCSEGEYSASVPHAAEVTESSGALKFYLDKGVFLERDSLARVEIYSLFSVPAAELEAGEPYEYEVEVELIAKDERNPVEDSWTEKAVGTNVVDKFDLYLRPGEYELRMEIVGTRVDSSGSAALSIQVPAPTGNLTASDVKLAWEFGTDTLSKFCRYGVEAVPNPLAAYNPDRDTLYYLLEVYNLAQDTATYALAYGIYDQNGKLVKAARPTFKKKTGTRAVEIGGVHIGDLSQGGYTLELEVVDMGSGKRIASRKDFLFYTSHGREKFQFDTSAVGFIDYFASKEELSDYERMSEGAKEMFLLKFWNARDPVPETPENELLFDVIRRVRFADENFSQGLKKGRHTDRGRIYIKYGPPEERTKIPFSVDYKDREEWYYYSGNLEFIFVDIRGGGNYELVYSSISEEEGYRNWSDYIPVEGIKTTEEGW
jgi:GWxTD domain-containing protein